ncbi:MAG TPA: PAS domain S-box protein, partial [Leptolinea sp.]
EIITGIPRLEAIGTPYWEIQYRILPPERQAQRSPEYFQKAMTAAFVNGQIPQTGTSTEVLIQTAGGESKSIFQVSFPIRTETGYRIGAVVRDVTERKKAEDSLQSTTLRLTALLEHMQTGILFEDLRRHVALTNQAFCDLFSIPALPSTLVGADCRQSLQSSKQLMSDPEEFVQKTEQLVSKNEPLSNEELSLADGRTFERDYIPISIGNQLTGHLWQYRDITERKRAEAAVRESEEKFRLSFMTGLDAFYIARLEEGQFIETNQVFEDVFGYARDEIIGKTAIQLGIYQNPADRAKLFSELGAKGYIKDLEIKAKKKNGEIITISLSINLVLINNQKHILGVIRDITERKRVEEHLELLKYSIDTSPDGAYWFDPEGSFLYVNESGCKSLGYTMEELSHLRISDINLRSTPERWAEVWQIIKEKKVFTAESVHRRKDGSEFPVEITSTYVKFGELEYCNGFARDITARKRTEQTLLENEEHFRAVVQTAHDAIITIDTNGKIIAWNTAAETIFGYSTNDAVGMPVSR